MAMEPSSQFFAISVPMSVSLIYMSVIGSDNEIQPVGLMHLVWEAICKVVPVASQHNLRYIFWPLCLTRCVFLMQLNDTHQEEEDKEGDSISPRRGC